MGMMTRKVMQVDNLAFGHTSSSGGFFGYSCGKLITKFNKNKKIRDSEDIKVPKSLS